MFAALNPFSMIENQPAMPQFLSMPQQTTPTKHASTTVPNTPPPSPATTSTQQLHSQALVEYISSNTRYSTIYGFNLHKQTCCGRLSS